jgi:hypothetical protein
MSLVWYVAVLVYFWDMIKLWLHTIFVVPFINSDMLWLLVPIWIAWFFAEFFQEKKGTSLGNAMSNAVVILWGSIDCTRQTIRLISEGVLTSSLDIVGRFVLVALLFTYGLIIVILGWKGNPIIKKIGRIREVTYFFVMFVPIFYNAISFSFKHLLTTLLFFPVFYYLIELIDVETPDSEALKEDEKESEGQKRSSF